jgi:hypothetical protein
MMMTLSHQKIPFGSSESLLDLLTLLSVVHSCLRFLEHSYGTVRCVRIHEIVIHPIPATTTNTIANMVSSAKVAVFITVVLAKSLESVAFLQRTSYAKQQKFTHADEWSPSLVPRFATTETDTALPQKLDGKQVRLNLEVVHLFAAFHCSRFFL